ncbi:MAG TPA: PAS domain S-box protein [Flavisolibacter sp.]|jgi:PAS domain S-box-containing protein
MLQPAEATDYTIFQTMADDAPVMIWITDPSGYCTYLNKQWLAFTGQTIEESRGLGWTNAIHPDDREEAGRIFMECSKLQQPFHCDYRVRHTSGEYRWAVDSGKPRFDNTGGFLGFIGTVTDITERKLAEEELQINEARLRIAIESTELGTWDFYPETGILNWDNRCKELFGMSHDAHVDYAIFLKALHPDDRERVDKIVQEAFRPESGGSFNEEYRTIGLEDKKLRWVSAKGRAYFDESGRVKRFIGTVLNITQRKAIEEELKSSDERLREALTVASTGTWKIDLETGIDTRDASLNKMLGLEAIETRIPVSDSFERIHPNDKERMKAALEEAVQNKSVYDEEVRIFQPGGRMLWIRDRGQVVQNEHGEASYIIGAAIDITEQKQKEEQLKISEERFRSFFNNSSVGMALVSLNGTFLQVNPVFLRLFGYTAEEILTKDIQSVTHPAFISGSIGKLQQTILGQTDGFVAQKKYLKKNGEEFWGEVAVSLVKDLSNKPKHLIGVLYDIHDKKLAEESLKLQARVLESMDEGVSVSDEAGVILYTNSAEDKMFGYGPGELIGQHVTIQNAYTPEENGRIVDSVMSELKSNGYWNGEWHNKRKDGSEFYTYSHITSLDLEQKRVLVCVQRDITEEKKYKEFLEQSAEELEKRVKERTSELKEANELLEKSNAELEQFAYVTSHDLQEPLRKIRTFASRIEDELAGSGNTNVMKHLQKVMASSERMSVLIRDLLNYSRLTKEEKEFKDVDLNEVLEDVLSDFEVLIAQKKAQIIADPLPTLKGISLQVNQLFFNLIGNSLKFSRPDVPPRIEIRAGIINAEAALELGLKGQDYHRLIFSDNGIGFNPGYKEQIFEIFQRLNSRDQYAGTGIGLALSKRVVENHGGAIIAESEEGKGASFTVYLAAI